MYSNSEGRIVHNHQAFRAQRRALIENELFWGEPDAVELRRLNDEIEQLDQQYREATI